MLMIWILFISCLEEKVNSWTNLLHEAGFTSFTWRSRDADAAHITTRVTLPTQEVTVCTSRPCTEGSLHWFRAEHGHPFMHVLLYKCSLFLMLSYKSFKMLKLEWNNIVAVRARLLLHQWNKNHSTEFIVCLRNVCTSQSALLALFKDYVTVFQIVQAWSESVQMWANHFLCKCFQISIVFDQKQRLLFLCLVFNIGGKRKISTQ